MDIPVNAAKPGRRRYLTLVMIFITVVICYVDRANLVFWINSSTIMI